MNIIHISNISCIQTLKISLILLCGICLSPASSSSADSSDTQHTVQASLPQPEDPQYRWAISGNIIDANNIPDKNSSYLIKKDAKKINLILIAKQFPTHTEEYSGLSISKIREILSKLREITKECMQDKIQILQHILCLFTQDNNKLCTTAQNFMENLNKYNQELLAKVTKFNTDSKLSDPISDNLSYSSIFNSFTADVRSVICPILYTRDELEYEGWGCTPTSSIKTEEDKRLYSTLSNILDIIEDYGNKFRIS